MTTGKFIAFEGGEGTGKSTQAKLLAEALQEEGITSILTREPGGTIGAEAIRNLVLDPPGDGWNIEAEALLFAAARADHVSKKIIPALKSGTWVICDRFIDSSRAYQGAAGMMGDDAILRLHEIGSGGIRPDLVILLLVDEDNVSDRLIKRDGNESDAIGGRNLSYHRNVSESFKDLASANPDQFMAIEAGGIPKEVHKKIVHAVLTLLER